MYIEFTFSILRSESVLLIYVTRLPNTAPQDLPTSTKTDKISRI